MNLQDGITMVEALTITAFSMLLVFAALIIISIILDGFKMFANRQEKKTNNKSPIGTTRKADELATNATPEKLVTEDELELIAVITASIAATLQTSTSNIVVRNITRIPQTTPLWGLVSRQQMTNK